MRFIKKYEGFFDVKYKVDDYVIIKHLKYPFCKILNVNRVTASYVLEFLFNDNLTTEWVDERDIVGEMTPEQIKEFELKKASIKYNI